MMESQMVFLCRSLQELSTGQESLDIINADEDLQVLGCVNDVIAFLL